MLSARDFRIYYVEVLDIVPVYNSLLENPKIVFQLFVNSVFFYETNVLSVPMLPSWRGLLKILNETFTWLNKG